MCSTILIYIKEFLINNLSILKQLSIDNIPIVTLLKENSELNEYLQYIDLDQLWSYFVKHFDKLNQLKVDGNQIAAEFLSSKGEDLLNSRAPTLTSKINVKLDDSGNAIFEKLSDGGRKKRKRNKRTNKKRKRNKRTNKKRKRNKRTNKKRKFSKKNHKC